MVRRCSDKMAKLLMFVFNLIFMVCGIVILYVCLSDRGRMDHIKTIVSGLSSATIVFIVVGVIIFVVSFLGCCGAIRENSCMVTTFMVLLTLILIGEIAVGIVAFNGRGKVDGIVKNETRKTLSDTSAGMTNAWDDIQHSLKCCGATGPQDYIDFNRTIPLSCCNTTTTKTEKCDITSPVSKDIYHDGCVKAIEDALKGHLYYVGLVAILIAFIEVAGIIFACCLRGAINEKYETV